MAELASPESWCTGNGTVGSNPTPSAARGADAPCSSFSEPGRVPRGASSPTARSDD